MTKYILADLVANHQSLGSVLNVCVIKEPTLGHVRIFYELKILMYAPDPIDQSFIIIGDRNVIDEKSG